jgi:AcrR family transcriptional regulator
VTTGALYHHFGSKRGLFQVVAEQLEAEILAAAADGVDPWQRLREEFDQLIDVCAAQDVQRIIFIEAPQVIGPEARREIELRHAYDAIRMVREGLMADGMLRRCPVDLVARSLLALLDEAAAEVARASGDRQVRSQFAEMMTSMLDALAARRGSVACRRRYSRESLSPSAIHPAGSRISAATS